MARSLLVLIAMFMLAVCNLHSPSMLHIDEADHHAHAGQMEAIPADIGDHLGDPESEPDSDHGIAPTGDHHAPAALAVTGSGIDNTFAALDVRHVGGSSAALASWAMPPPIEPPAA